MYNEDLTRQYQNKSRLELLLIAKNYDGGYTSDAIETAKHILSSKYNEKIESNNVLEKEVERLFELDKKCSLCKKMRA